MRRSPRIRENLEQLLDLAQASKGWSRRRLARALGRDASKLIPASGIPKLDLVLALANLLEWSMTEVVERIWSPHSESPNQPAAGRTFADLNSEARNAYSQGRFADVLAHASLAYESAASPDERALACNRAAAGWDGRGCYVSMLSSLQRGLNERAVASEIRRMLQSNLAGAYYGLSKLVEAKSVASHLVDSFEECPPQCARDIRTEAFARFLSGQTYRRLCLEHRSERRDLALRARGELRIALARFEGYPSPEGYELNTSIAYTCTGALMEVEVILGLSDARKVLSAFEQRLEAIVDCSTCASADWLESFGWWCISGCNLAERFVADTAIANRYLAIFTNKADEIAEQLDNWSLRERVSRFEFDQSRGATRSRSNPDACVLDDQDVRNILGVMGRFPAFRSTGWEILNAAGLARGE